MSSGRAEIIRLSVVYNKFMSTEHAVKLALKFQNCSPADGRVLCEVQVQKLN